MESLRDVLDQLIFEGCQYFCHIVINNNIRSVKSNFCAIDR